MLITLAAWRSKLIDDEEWAGSLVVAFVGKDMVLVGTWTGSEVVASFAADFGVPTWEMGTLVVGSQTEEHWDTVVRRSLILTAQGRPSSQRGSLGTLIIAC
jgi:hypothetical protein